MSDDRISNAAREQPRTMPTRQIQQKSQLKVEEPDQLAKLREALEGKFSQCHLP